MGYNDRSVFKKAGMGCGLKFTSAPTTTVSLPSSDFFSLFFKPARLEGFRLIRNRWIQNSPRFPAEGAGRVRIHAGAAAKD